MTTDLTEYVSILQELAKTLSPDVRSRTDTRALKTNVEKIQTACQHVFTEIKAINRTLPQ